MSGIKISGREGSEALISTSLTSAGDRSGSIASSSPLPDTTLADHLLLYTGIYIKSLVDVGEGDYKWAFIVAPADEKPDSKGRKYWMAKMRDFTGLTTVRGCREGALIDLRDEKDLLCRILLAEIGDMEKLHNVMSLPRLPKIIMEDEKWDSVCWVRGMLGQLMREGCLKGGLVAWDVVAEEGFEKADNRVKFNEKHAMPKGSGPWTVNLLNREESDVSVKCLWRLDSRADADLAKEWLIRKSESPELEDHASFVKRMNAYWDDDSPSLESSRIDDEGGKDTKGPDPSSSLVPSKKPRSRVREVVAKGKQMKAAGVTKTAPPECPPSSQTQPRVLVVVPSKAKSGFRDSNSDAENQAKSLRKSPAPSNFTTPPEYPVGHSKRKRLVDPDSPSH